VSPLSVAHDASAPKQIILDCHTATDTAVNSLGHKVVLRIARLLVTGVDRLWAAVRPFNICHVQPPPIAGRNEPLV
jgi:hypothetical protein